MNKTLGSESCDGVSEIPTQFPEGSSQETTQAQNHSNGHVSGDDIPNGAVLTDPALSRKRKTAGLDTKTDADAPSNAADIRNGFSKKAKLDATGDPASWPHTPLDKSALSAEIWHYIFTFLPPRTLGNLLSVNKLFNFYLDPSSSVVVEKPPPLLANTVAKAMEPNAIWRSARRSFWPKMPGPLKDKTELDMWRIACSSTCQFCGKRDTRRSLPPSDPLRHGPDSDGVAFIWEFRVRCCGYCLSSRTVKEMDLIMSSTPTFLLPALQFVFVTANTCIIPLNVIERGQLPSSFTLTKLFWTSDVDSLCEEFVSVKELGASAVEEWQKGLSTRGSSQRSDIAKWEKYAESGGVLNMRTLLYPGYRNKPTEQAVKEPTVPQADISSQFLKPPATKLANIASEPVVEKETREALSPKNSVRGVVPGVGKVLASPPVAKNQDTAQPLENKKKTKEDIDAEWDDIQGPVRLKILKYADEAIIGDWDEGEEVTKDNAPVFAADVLLHVRKRFYMEAANEAKAARAAGREPVIDPPEGPFTQKLSLENMKYVFDVKIKPITANIRKELFLCNGCPYNGKFFEFEGVIQHFAAKHTTALSVGNVVVHWRAEWPKHPPFRANPRRPKTGGRPKASLPLKPPSHRVKNLPGAHPAKVHKQLPASRPPPPSLQASLPMSSPRQAQQPPQLLPSGANGVLQYPAEPPQFPPSTRLYSQPGTLLPNQSAFQQPTYQQQAQLPYQLHEENVNQTAGYFLAGPGPLPHQGYSATSSGPVPTPMTAMPNGFKQSNGPAAKEKAHEFVPGADFHAKLNEIALHSSGLWRATTDMRRLPGVVRIYAVIFHLNIFFQKRFGEPVPLSLFVEGLSNRKELRPLRYVNELMCKACYLGLGPRADKQEERSLFSFPELASHFLRDHEQYDRSNQKGSRPLNWMADMLLLPQATALSNMVGPQGKTFPLLFKAVKGILRSPGRDDDSHQVAGKANLSSEVRRPPNGPAARPSHKTEMRQKDSAKDNKQNKQSFLTGPSQLTAEEASQEEERRQTESIRDMWALDRARKMEVAGQMKSSMPALQHPNINSGSSTEQGDKAMSRAERKRQAKANALRPHEHNVLVKQEESNEVGRVNKYQVPRFVATASEQAEAPDLLGALEMHLDDAPTQQSSSRRSPTSRDAPAHQDSARVTHAQEHRYHDLSLHDHRYQPRQGQRSIHHAPDERRLEVRQRRPLSPDHPGFYSNVSHDAAVRGQARQYRDRSPLPARYHDEVYEERGPPQPPTMHYYAHGQPQQEHRYEYADECIRAAPASQAAGYEPYEAYEIVRVIHPDGEYYVRRPVRRELVIPTDNHPSERYYRPVAPPVYEDPFGRPPVRREYGEEYYADASFSGGYESQPYTAAPVYGRPGEADDIARSGRERMVVPHPSLQEASRPNEPYYEEYDPRHPSMGPGPGLGPPMGRVMPPASTQEGGRRQVRYQ